MYYVHAKAAPKSLLDKFAKINTEHHDDYNTRLSAKECFSVKFSSTEKMKKSFTRICVSIWNSIPLSVKTLNISNCGKKIKSPLLNVLGNEDNYNLQAVFSLYLVHKKEIMVPRVPIGDRGHRCLPKSFSGTDQSTNSVT